LARNRQPELAPTSSIFHFPFSICHLPFSICQFPSPSPSTAHYRIRCTAATFAVEQFNISGSPGKAGPVGSQV
jgi:hypothetical protein